MRHVRTRVSGRMTGRSGMRTLLAALMVGLVAIGGTAGAGNARELERMSAFGRNFLLFSPASLGNRQAPIVIALHGGLGNALAFQQNLGLNGQAAAMGFRVAYLQGTPVTRATLRRRVWNAGGCCGSAARNGVDDVGYIAGAIRELEAQGLVSGGNIWLVGHSNGAMMAYRFACERGSMIRGVVGIAGAVTVPNCRGAGNLKVLEIHGEADANVPVRGGRGIGRSGVAFPSLDETVRALQGAGASVSVDVIPGAEHDLGSVDAGMRRARGYSLAQAIAGFISR